MITTKFSLPVNGRIVPVTANLFIFHEGEPMETNPWAIAPYTWSEFCVVVNDTDTYSININWEDGEVGALLYVMDDDSADERVYGITLTGILLNAITEIYRDMTRPIPAELLYGEFDDDDDIII